MVCTYVTFQSRNAVREVGKVLGLPTHVLDRMAKSVSSYGSRHMIGDLMEVPEFKGYLDTEAWRHFQDLCTKIADFPRHLSIHVGGMIDRATLQHAGQFLQDRPRAEPDLQIVQLDDGLHHCALRKTCE